MRFLVFGAGMLGKALERLLVAERHEVSVRPHADCDIRSAGAIRTAIEEIHPQVIVNAAAFTRVDDCEEERETAFSVNGMAPGLLAREARRAGSLFVQISTDFVFDGKAAAPYGEQNETAPLSVYGASKLLGEQETMREGGDFLIVRTSWHFGAGGKNFVQTMVSKAMEGRPLRVVSDQLGRPTYSGHLARALLNLIGGDCRGLYHYADQGETSWYDLAKAAIESAGIDASSILSPITTADFPCKARRPAYSVLSTDKYERATGEAVPSFTEGLAIYVPSISPIEQLATKGALS